MSQTFQDGQWVTGSTEPIDRRDYLYQDMRAPENREYLSTGRWREDDHTVYRPPAEQIK